MATSEPRSFTSEDQKFVNKNFASFTPGQTVWIGFPTTDPYGSDPTFAVFQSPEQQVANEIFRVIGGYINLTLRNWNETPESERPAVPDVRVWFSLSKGNGGSATVQTDDPSKWDILIGSEAINLARGEQTYWVLIHELSHTLGLKHPFDSPAPNTTLPTNDGIAIDESVMSYTNVGDHVRTLPNGQLAFVYPITLQLLDIEALKRLYGSNAATNAGQTTYTFLPEGVGIPGNELTTIYGNQVKTIYDSGGAGDKFDASSYTTDVTINLNPGGFIDESGEHNFSSIGGNRNIAIAYGTEIEDAVAGSGNDTLIGNGLANVLIGGGGNDELTGGGAPVGQMDTLDGGAGRDVYIWKTGDGNIKIVEDASRQGEIRITINSNEVSTKTFQEVAGSNDTVYITSDGQLTLNHQSPWTLVLPDGSTIDLGETFADGDLGINLRDAQAAHTDETITLTLAGDLEPVDFDPDTPGTQTQTDALGNVIVTGNPEPGRNDTLFGDASADAINGLDGDDAISGRAGDDDLDGGNGDDALFGEAGFDLLLGGAGGDFLDGGADDDELLGGVGDDAMQGGLGYDRMAGETGRDLLSGQEGDDELYAGELISLADLDDALAAGDIQAGTGLPGDLLDGGAGEDIAIGGADDDQLSGAGGADVLAGGGGNDNLQGDWALVFANPGWSATRTVTTEADGTTVYTLTHSEAFFDIAPDGGADEIYGGAGEDWVFAGAGEDYIDLGADNDVAFGDAGFDVLFGGAGNDVLVGDNHPDALPSAQHGDDYLDGEDGNDELFGYGGNDQLFGGTGNDFLYGDSSSVEVAYQGADYLDGEEGDDQLYGYGGNDELFGGAGAGYVGGECGQRLPRW